MELISHRQPGNGPAQVPSRRQSSKGFLETAYASLFNRAPDAPGLAYWTDGIVQRLESGGEIGTALLDIISGAGNAATGDGAAHNASTLWHQITVAQTFTGAIKASSWRTSSTSPQCVG